jgi:molybdate transport system permease protein
MVLSCPEKNRLPANRKLVRLLRQLALSFLRLAGWGGIILIICSAIAFISLPILALIWRTVRDRAWQIPLDERVPRAIEFSLKTTAISLFFIVVLGTPLAYALARWRFPGKRLANVLIDLPIVLPPAVAGLGLLVAFGRRGLLGPILDDWFGIRLAFTQAAVVMAQTFVAFPFYVRTAQVGFRAVDPEIEKAALVDGASHMECFMYVTFPLSRRALLSGGLVSWARALGEFGATIFFAGNLLGRPQTMPLLIYSIFENDVDAATWTALILIGAAACIIFLARLLTRAE